MFNLKRVGPLFLIVVSTGMIISAGSQMPLLVCPNGCPFTSIQWAIESAPEGATIIVGTGIYRENLLIEKSLTIIGAGPEVTRIEGWRDDLPVIRILGPEEDFHRLLEGEEGGEPPGLFPVVVLQGLGVAFPGATGASRCPDVQYGVRDIDGEGCAAEVLVRGPARLILGESKLSGTTPPQEPPTGGLFTILADVTMYSTQVRGNGINLYFYGGKVTLHDNLIEENYFPHPHENDTASTVLRNLRGLEAFLYRNRIMVNFNGVMVGGSGLRGDEYPGTVDATLIENEIRGSKQPGSGIGIVGHVWSQLVRNVITGHDTGLGATSEAAAGVVVCEGNEFLDNEEDLLVTSLETDESDPEGLAELAQRCGVDLGDEE